VFGLDTCRALKVWTTCKNWWDTFFLVHGDWGRKDAFKVAIQVLPSINFLVFFFFFNLYHVFVCLYACRRGVDATCNWHFHPLKSFPSINSSLWFAWIQVGRIGKKLDINFILISLIFRVDLVNPCNPKLDFLTGSSPGYDLITMTITLTCTL